MKAVKPSLWVRLKIARAYGSRAWKTWFTAPAPTPDDLALARAKPSKRQALANTFARRPLHLELAFELHPNGKVYQLRRDKAPKELVTDDHMQAAVHREYRILYELARRQKFNGGPPDAERSFKSIDNP